MVVEVSTYCQGRLGWDGGNANLITSVAPCDQSMTEKVSLGSLEGFLSGDWVLDLCVVLELDILGTQKGCRPVLRPMLS